MKLPEDRITHSSAETEMLGEELSRLLGNGDVVGFIGDLGTGKTTMIKGIARGLGIDPNEVSSPSFALIHEYIGRFAVHHIDLYRIERPSEVAELGLWEIFDDGISLVEWADRALELLPKNALVVRIERTAPAERRIEFGRK